MVEKVFNELFAPAEVKKRKNITEFSMQELLALGTPVIFSAVVVIYLAMVSIESGMYHLMINSFVLQPVRNEEQCGGSGVGKLHRSLWGSFLGTV